MLIQHSSPLGTLYVPALGVDVAPGVPTEVPDDVAGVAPAPYPDPNTGDPVMSTGSGLLAQSDLWHVSEE